MKIAITHPTTWPHVRRGAERFIHELSIWLSRRGHDVTIISAGASADSGAVDMDGAGPVRLIRCRRWWHPALARVGVREMHAFAGPSLITLLRGRWDVVHCCGFTDAVAAGIARRLTGVPYLFWMNGVPAPVPAAPGLTTGGRLFGWMLRDAGEVVVLSEYMRTYLQERFAVSARVVPVPVRLDPVGARRVRRADRPTIVCAAALDDPRKGGPVLFRSFNVVKESWPGAQLRIASRVSASTELRLRSLVRAEWQDDVVFTGDGTPEELPETLASAWVSVLPSLWEGFGMIVLESMASGTPVVGSAHGALPELIAHPDVGRLFDPGPPDGSGPSNAADLAEALCQTLELSSRPDTSARCRAHAANYGWDTLGPVFERLYEDLYSGNRSGARSALPAVADVQGR